ncbi:uncharacterized protein [Ptychodera flava]|uniref:uncharacterized protein n=1 Tax=Ptychodera flava TaxID=63121 RepID=UPI003969E077
MMRQSEERKRLIQIEMSERREDIQAWKIGMVFITVILAAMFALGSFRGWDANSGYTHNISKTSRGRFLPEPYHEEFNVTGRYGIDASARWYYWKLAPQRVTVLTRGAVWLCYIFHQVFVWTVIYEAQIRRRQSQEQKYSTDLAPPNWKALYINACFHLVHLIQTHVFYDALAQDVSVASSQGSVIMLLVLVLLMEYKDRGLAFGWPTEESQGFFSQKLRLGTKPIDFIRKYHGYAFAWAAVYTFWYHPMENTWAHASGFVFTWMLMLQGSLMYTNMHLNRYWRLLLEFWALVHATAVAVQSGGPDLNGTKMWPMFFCGFLWLFAMTQLFGLPFWAKLPAFTRFLPFVCYSGFVIWLFSWLPEKADRPWVRINEAFRIPVIEYLLVVLAWFVMNTVLRSNEWVSFIRMRSGAVVVPKIVYTCGFLGIYVGLVTISWLVQALDAQFYIVPITICLTLIYIVGACLSFVLVHQKLHGAEQKIK